MDARVGRSRAASPGRRIGVTVIAATLAAMCANPAVAAQSNADGHFELSGAGTLKLDPKTLQSGNRLLKASLTPAAADVEKSIVLSDDHFAITGGFASSAVVCYNDTIFRDDFDGDGF